MAKYQMVVLTNPASPDQEDAFNHWYDEQHIPELLEIPGMLSGQRYRLGVGADYSYMAIYDVETDDLDALMTEMYRRVDDGEIAMSPAWSSDFLLVAGDAIGGRHQAVR